MKADQGKEGTGMGPPRQGICTGVGVGDGSGWGCVCLGSEVKWTELKSLRSTSLGPEMLP